MNRSGILFAVAASVAFGCATAIIGIVKRPELVAFTVGGALLSLCAVAGPRNVVASLFQHPRLFFSIGVLDAVNIIAFYGSLALGPVPLMTALHLTAPLWLILVAVLRGRRPTTWLLASEVVIVLGALLVSALKPGGAYSSSGVLWGSVLALVSAMALVVLNLTVASKAVDHDPATAAGAQFVIVLAMLSPLLFLSDSFPIPDIAWLTVAGMFGLAPGLILIWRALQRLDPSTTSVIGLNEAVVASAIVAVIVPGSVTVHAAVSGVLILAAMGAEIWSDRNARELSV